MAPLLEQRNLNMTPDLWAALEALAVATNSRSTRGPQARQHSWRTLIERIAGSEIILTEREPYQMPPGLDEAVRQLEQRQAEQARLEEQQRVAEEQRRRIAEHQKQVIKQPLKLEQLHMELEPA